MRHAVILGPISVVLGQRSEIIDDSKVFVDDVLLGSTYVLRRKDVELLRALGDLKDELEQPDCRLARCRRSLKEFDRCITSEVRFVLRG